MSPFKLPKIRVPRKKRKALAGAIDTTPKRNAREWFAYLLPKLEASRQVTVYNEGEPNERTVVGRLNA